MSQEAKDQSTLVDDHKKMVIMTGNLSDFQLTNLKTWPFLLLEGLLKVEITYDFTKLVADAEELAPGMIQFDFTFYDSAKLDREATKKQLETLSLWTKFMFWKETKVKFMNKGKAWEV